MSMALRLDDHPKSLGAFYTPDAIASLLAGWVVKTGDEILLEPSAGEGALVKAALEFASFTPRPQGLRIIACDVNPGAIGEVARWLKAPHSLHFGDFLELEPDQIGLVDAVIANPPFTRNHALEPERRQELRARYSVEGAAGLWVHFLLHACEFIVPGGRLAAVVPAAAAFSGYGRKALARICSRFETVELLKIVDKPTWVNGADERGLVVLAAGYGRGESQVPKLVHWSATDHRKVDAPVRSSSYYAEAVGHSKRLDELAILSIGAVTGQNRTFLLNEAERVVEEIELDDVVEIVGRARHVRGLTVNPEELRELAYAGERTWLLAPRDIGKDRRGVRARLSRIKASARRETVWLTKRTPWWKVDAGPDCDAIFTYMNDLGPRLILARGAIKCTNTLHRVRFHDGVERLQRVAAALSMVSTFGQLAAERTGRSYGGGVLKFELREARSLPVLPPAQEGLELAFAAADEAIRKNNKDAARTIADRYLLSSIFGGQWQAAAEDMAVEMRRLRADRRGKT